MTTLATLFGDILTVLRHGLTRHAGSLAVPSSPLAIVTRRIGRMATRLHNLFARFQAGTLPSQTGAKPRPSRAGTSRAADPATPRERLPAARRWLAHIAMVPTNTAASQLQHWMTHPDLRPFLAAAPQAGRILRPLCRLLGIEAQPDAPAELNLPNPPRFRPAPPPAPIYLGIIDPPEMQPRYLSLAHNRAGRAWYQ